MPSSYTSSLRLTLPATGELSGSWGSTVNTGITELLDAAVAGTASISTWGGAGVAYTLSSTNGAADEARKMFIVASGSPGEAKNVICPAVSKFYVFRNDTTGGYALTLKTGSGTGISVPAGQYRFLYCDGTNVVEAFNSAAAIALSGNLTLNGGTANGVLYLNGSKVATSGSALVFDGTNLGLQATPSAWSTTTSVLENPSGSIYTFSGTNQIGLNSNAYYNGTNWIYRNASSVGASDFFQQNGFFVWRNAAAGTAGNTITYSELMRLTSTGLGIGTSSPGVKLDVNGGSIRTTSWVDITPSTATNNALYRSTNTGGTFYSGLDNSAGGVTGTGYAGALWHTGAYPIAFGTSNALRMTLDSSGNLGIGTSSPTQRFEASFLDTTTNRTNPVNVAAITATSASNGGAPYTGFGPALVFRSQSYNGTVYNGPRIRMAIGDDSVNTTTGASLAFDVTATKGASPTQAAVIDPSGNLGLGVTPSAWGATYKAMSFGAGGNESSISGQTDANRLNLISNGYFNGTNWIYGNSVPSGRYRINQNAHEWYTAPSGTAGNTISFTQSMTLDASGNLGIGTTSPNYKLSVVGGILVTLSGQGQIWNGATGIYTTWQYNGTSVGDIGTADEAIYGGSTADFGITSRSGNLVLGTSSTERARITSGGDLLVGTTGTLISGGSRLRITNGSGPTIDAQSTNVGNAVLDAWNSATSGDNIFERFWTEGVATQRGSIDYDRAGGLVRYNTTSDYRAKDIIGPVQNPGAIIDALKVYEGVMKGATQSRPMLIAHEAQAHAPYAVSGVKDEVNEDGTPKFQQMDVSSLVPLLLAEIQSLRARVAALEAK